MRLRVFRAPTMAAAMAKVRQDLGPDALILGDRRAADGVEVTAAAELAESLLPAQPPASNNVAAALRWHGVPAPLAARLCSAPLASVLAFRSLDLAADGSPLLLVGPPGAGKTLTAARLATRLMMTGVAPLVITADGQRAGATEQLAAFTRLLGLTLTVANQPGQLAKALTRRDGGMPVLIDAAGLDPFDPAQATTLRSLVEAAGARPVLVLPAGLDAAEAADLGAAFHALGARHLVATRLDVTRRIGGVLAAANTGLALAEAGIGPGAADGLIPFTPALLQQRLAVPAGAKLLEDA